MGRDSISIGGSRWFSVMYFEAEARESGLARPAQPAAVRLMTIAVAASIVCISSHNTQLWWLSEYIVCPKEQKLSSC
jgi:hypothetical protein